MSAVIWPFPPRLEMIEVLEWATDVLRAKSAEQRISMRRVPRRTFQLSHILTDYQHGHAQALIRDAQGGDGFVIPDWGQSTPVSFIPSGSNIALSVDLSNVEMGVFCLLWESYSKFEIAAITNDSNGVELLSVTQGYTDVQLMPIWIVDAPEGLNNQRSAGGINIVNIAMTTDQGDDLSVTPPTTYRGLDVLDDCPIVGAGTLDETSGWPVSVFGNFTTIAHYIRQRTVPDIAYNMRWHVFTQAEQYALRAWLHYRRGRQKAFWMSSRCKDFEPAASITSAGSVILRVFSFPGLTGLGRDDPFDIQIKTPSTQYNRRITAIAIGAAISGRPTLELTMSSSLGTTLSMSNMSRISFLRCNRLDADRIELLHKAGEGMQVQVPVIEIPEP